MRSKQMHGMLARTCLLALGAAMVLQVAPAAVHADGPAGGEFRANTTTAGQQRSSSVAMDADGDFVVVWSGNGPGDTSGINFQLFDANGTPRGGETRANSTTPNGQLGPVVAMDADGDFVIVWSSASQDGDDLGVFGQLYNAAGVPRGGEFQVNVTTAHGQENPGVAMNADGEFVVVWTNRDGPVLQVGINHDAMGRRYSADGAPLGGEIHLAQVTAGEQFHARVAIDRVGNWVAAWSSENVDGSDHGVVARLFAANGTPRGDQFLVNQFTTGFQAAPFVATDASGNLVVTWTSATPDGNGSYVAARVFAADGSPRGNEVQVNQAAAGEPEVEGMAMDADGDFVVAWESDGQDGSEDASLGRRFAPDGTPRGGEFRLNTTTVGDQRQPAVAMDADADFVAAWGGNGPGDDVGIFVQRFSFNDRPTISAVVNQTAVEGVATAPIALTVGDAETDPASLTLTVSSSDPALVPSAGIVLGGSGANRTVTITPSLGLVRAATVTLTVSDGELSVTTSFTLSATRGQANLVLQHLDVPDPVPLGRPLTYRLRVTNNGPHPASGVALFDTLPLGVRFRGAIPSQGACSNTGRNVTCNLGTLLSGATANVQVVVTPTAGELLTNAARAQAAQTDVTPANNQSVQRTRTSAALDAPARADLRVVQSAPSSSRAGRPLTYTVTVSNLGPDPATSARLVDTLPPNALFVSATPTQGRPCTQAGRMVNCLLGTIAPGAPAEVRIVVTPTGTGPRLNSARATAAEADPNPANNLANRSVPVVP